MSLVGAVATQNKKRPRRQSKFSKRKKTKVLRKERAYQQVLELHNLLITTSDLALKRNYVKHIRAIAQKVQLKLPFSIKNSFCRRCSEVFTVEPERTFSVRLRNKPEPMIIYTCLHCGYRRKKLYSKKKKE